MARLTLLVLRVSDLEASAAFYRALGLTLVPEQHGDGPPHVACALGRTVMELYPAGERPVTRTRLGLTVPSIADAIRQSGAHVVSASQGRAVLVDPDGNRVVLEHDVDTPG